MSWLVKGLLIGAAVAIAGVLIAGTGGLAAAAIIGGMAAGGAGIGELMSTMSWAPKEITGAILGACSTNVFTNSRPAARAHLDFVACSKHPTNPPPPIATGSGNVYINSLPAARVNDKTGCGGDITEGSGNVNIGGGTQQTDPVSPENLVPGWVHAAILVVGVGAAIALAGPIVAAAGLVGGLAGGAGGAWLGGKIWGDGSDGQKWAMLGGSLIGGYLGTKGGMAIANKAIPNAVTDQQGFLKGGLSGKDQAQQTRYDIAKTAAEQRVKEINEAPKSDFPNGRKPAKVSAAINKRTGEVHVNESGIPYPERIDPNLSNKMPNPSLEPDWDVQNCAEFKVANDALLKGAKMEDLEIYTINRRYEPVHRCANCQITTDGAFIHSE